MTLDSLNSAIRFAACRYEDMPIGIGISVEVRIMIIGFAVFRTRKGTVHAVENRCPHRGGPLADGIVAGSNIVVHCTCSVTASLTANADVGGAPVFAGAGVLGDARPDVAALFGAQFANAGFHLEVLERSRLACTRWSSTAARP